MSGLGDFLELANRAPTSFRTLRAVVRTWRDEEACLRAFERAAERAQDGSTAHIAFYGGPGEESPSETEELKRVWLEPPGRLREEVDGPEPHVHVTDGARSWMRTPLTGPVELDGPDEDDVDHGHGLTRPLAFLAHLELEPVGPVTVAGREAAAARGRSKGHGMFPFAHGLDGLPDGADEYELALDRERGVVLRGAATLDDRQIAEVEVLEIAFDEELPPGTFVLEPLPGEDVRRIEEVYPHPELDLTLEEAAARVEFPLWTPAGLGPEWSLDVALTPDQVVLHFVTSWADRPDQLSLQQRPAGEDAPGPDFEEVERDGQRLLVWEPDSPLRLPVLVRLEREGTLVDLSSADLGRERLLELASSLVRVGAAPPPLLADE